MAYVINRRGVEINEALFDVVLQLVRGKKCLALRCPGATVGLPEYLG